MSDHPAAPDTADGSADDAADDIADEQHRIDAMYRRLDAMRDDARRRLSRVLVTGGGTPQARSERDSYARLHSEDIARFDAAEHGLCFGRLDVAGDDQRRYIGRLGILDEDDYSVPMLLDWRAPMARPFYLATAMSPDGVHRRRHIRTRGRRVVSVADEYLTASAAGDDPGSPEACDQAAGIAGEEALLAALDEARTGRMADIVETIQSEQDAIIRSEHRGVLVVQGGPGTGKTAVALHRAAYLLYNHRKQLARSGVLVVGPNTAFLDYIGRVLPSLGETGVLLSTIGDLYPGVTATGADSDTAATVKGSLSAVALLKKAVRDRQQVPGDPIEVVFDGYRLHIDAKTCRRARGRARSSRRPHNLARPVFRKAVIEALADELAETIGASIVDDSNLLSPADLSDIRRELGEDDAVRDAIDSLWPELTPQAVLMDLFGDAERIRCAGPGLTDDEVAALLRPAGRGFSPADAPLLDELAELLGTDDSADRDRERERWRRSIADAQDALDILTGSAPQDLEDELDPEILMAYDLLDARDLARRHDDAENRTPAERAAQDRTWAFGHVIVDEAQELSPMAWRMIMRRSPNRWMTVVGDTAQTGAVDGADTWDEVLSPYVAERWRLTELTVNYRTPGEIMAVASGLLGEIAPEQSPPVSARRTGTEPRAVAVPDGRFDRALPPLLAALPDAGTAAVLCPRDDADRIRAIAAGPVTVSPVDEVKGLEFDSVIVVDPAAIMAESGHGAQNLYVALTRATRDLTVVHSGLPEQLHGLLEGEVPAYSETSTGAR